MRIRRLRVALPARLAPVAARTARLIATEVATAAAANPGAAQGLSLRFEGGGRSADGLGYAAGDAARAALARPGIKSWR